MTDETTAQIRTYARRALPAPTNTDFYDDGPTFDDDDLRRLFGEEAV